MFSNFKLLVFAALVAAVSANPAFRNLIVHEQRVAAPEGFVSKGAAPADQLLDMRIALVQGDMSTLEKRLYEVSTPGSSQYGKHLSKEEVYIEFSELSHGTHYRRRSRVSSNHAPSLFL